MPDGITGRDLALRLRDSAPKLSVIYMSGYSHEVAGGDFNLEAGNNYLPKPFDLSSLAKLVAGQAGSRGDRVALCRLPRLSRRAISFCVARPSSPANLAA